MYEYGDKPELEFCGVGDPEGLSCETVLKLTIDGEGNDSTVKFIMTANEDGCHQGFGMTHELVTEFNGQWEARAFGMALINLADQLKESPFFKDHLE